MILVVEGRAAQNGPKMVPKRSQTGPKKVPNWYQNGTKMVQNRTKMVQNGFKMVQTGTKMAPGVRDGSRGRRARGPALLSHGANAAHGPDTRPQGRSPRKVLGSP